MTNFRTKPFWLLSLVLVCAWTARPARANVGRAFGFGARTAGLAGAGVAWGSEGYFGYANPAALSLLKDDCVDSYGSCGKATAHGGLPESETMKRIRISYGIIYMQPVFVNINNVVVENNYTSDKIRSDNVDVSYRPTFGQEIGFEYLIDPEWRNLAFGVTIFLPFEQVAYFDTGEPFVPEYVLYRALTQRPQFEIGLGGDLGPRVRFGLGIHIAYSLTSDATVFLQSGTGKSSMRFAASMKPKAAPVAALHYLNEPKSFAAGIVFRAPVASSNTMNLNTGAHIFPNLRGLDFNFNAISALFYDPLSVESGFSWLHSERARLYFQVDYEAWSSYQGPALVIQDVAVTNNNSGNGVVPNPGANPDFRYRDLIVPRIAEELNVSDRLTLRFGYSYRGSILRDLPTGPGNYLDPPKHILTSGVGFKFDHFLSFDTPCALDLNLNYEALQKRHIDKTPGDEAGDQTDQKIGAPGYDTGGYQWGGGITLSLAI